MKHSLFVSLLAFTLLNVALPLAAQTPTLQQGVSVQMAVTSNAQPMPAADDQNAWVIAVTADGELFFGADAVTPQGLADKMKSHPRQRDQKLYIKADERAPFANVRKVIAAAHEVGFQSAVLLTSQADSPGPEGGISPHGLEVLIGPHSNAAIVVQVSAAQPSPTLEVNEQKILATALQDTLKRLLQNQSDTTVMLKTSGPVAFAPVAHVIDTCHLVGTKVVLVTPLL